MQEEVFSVRMSDDLVNDKARREVVIHPGPFVLVHLPILFDFLLEDLIFVLLRFRIDVWSCLVVFQIGSERVVLGFIVRKEAGVVSFSDDDKCQVELWRIGLG